jgi:hypothetical protein
MSVRVPWGNKEHLLVSGLCSYLLPDSACVRLSHADTFWPTIHELGTLVDESPGYTPGMLDILLDFLSSECRINLPAGMVSRYSISHRYSLLSALRSDNISPICRLPNDAQRERGSACGGRHIVGPRGAQAMSGRAAARRKSFLEKRLLT